MAFPPNGNPEQQFDFLDGITILSFFMQCQTLRDIDNQTLLKVVHQDIMNIESRLNRMESKIDALTLLLNEGAQIDDSSSGNMPSVT